MQLEIFVLHDLPSNMDIVNHCTQRLLHYPLAEWYASWQRTPKGIHHRPIKLASSVTSSPEQILFYPETQSHCTKGNTSPIKFKAIVSLRHTAPVNRFPRRRSWNLADDQSESNAVLHRGHLTTVSRFNIRDVFGGLLGWRWFNTHRATCEARIRSDFVSCRPSSWTYSFHHWPKIPGDPMAASV